jgi:putative FmdB family regulatory protein
MPIYAYRCEACGFAKDVLQKISDDALTVCPSCHKDSFRKQLTAAGFQLKGSGWYVTDFRGNGSGRPTARVPMAPASPAPTPRCGRRSACCRYGGSGCCARTGGGCPCGGTVHPQRQLTRSSFPHAQILHHGSADPGPLAITLWVLNLIISTMDQSLLLLPGMAAGAGWATTFPAWARS